MPDRRFLRAALYALAFCLPALAGQAAELKVATWNLNWLTVRPAGDPALPEDVHPRGPDDFARLRQYAIDLNADVVALEEVDGREAAARVFPPEHYSLHLTHDRNVQRVGFAVRRGLQYEVNQDVTGIELAPELRLRSGADITLHLPAGFLRILAVHLKTGCPRQRLNNRRSREACNELREQISPIQAWIRARQQEHMPFLLMGDFNRWLNERDQVWQALDHTVPLLLATEGQSSPCWGHESFIDHIIAGGTARDWVLRGSLRVLTYRETGREWKARLSDHCPVSVRLRVPD